jgi:hypothetical protein
MTKPTDTPLNHSTPTAKKNWEKRTFPPSFISNLANTVEPLLAKKYKSLAMSRILQLCESYDNKEFECVKLRAKQLQKSFFSLMKEAVFVSSKRKQNILNFCKVSNYILKSHISKIQYQGRRRLRSLGPSKSHSLAAAPGDPAEAPSPEARHQEGAAEARAAQASRRRESVCQDEREED